MTRSFHILPAALLAVSLLSSCKKDKEEQTQTPAATVTAKEVVTNYSNIVYASYSDALTKSKELRLSAAAFISAPSQAGLDGVKNAYLAAREPYGQTDAYRFYDGPIDDAEGKEGLMNGWPLDEDYIDYVVGNSTSGIINDSVNYAQINKTVLEEANEVAGETNISTGYHAIEFLLWGQDLSQTGAGNRPYTDYVAGSEVSAARRGKYLLAAIDLLIDDLTYTAEAWAPAKDNYRKTFEAQDAQFSLKLILTGIGKFAKGELYGERMSVAYDTQSQEDEHSCFSDQTHRDFILGQKGIDNVFFGTYTRTDGTKISGKGIYDLVNAKNAAVAKTAKDALADAAAKVAAIQPPFDREIITGRSRVFAAIQSGNEEATQIVEVATALGIRLTL
ncbi:MAG: imelysin family protein [Bacteroidota bacterium]